MAHKVYSPSERIHKQVEEAFAIDTYLPHSDDQTQRVHDLRTRFRALAEAVILMTPEGRDQSLALTELESAFHWARSAIGKEHQTP